MDPLHVVEGDSVNLICSSSANPAADNYTWYKRTGSNSSTSMLQVGSGQVLSLPDMKPSQAGLYLCQVRNTVGVNNSPEMLLAMKEKQRGMHHFTIHCLFIFKYVIFNMSLYLNCVYFHRESAVSDLCRGWDMFYCDTSDCCAFILVSQWEVEEHGVISTVSHWHTCTRLRHLCFCFPHVVTLCNRFHRVSLWLSVLVSLKFFFCCHFWAFTQVSDTAVAPVY